MSEENSQQSPMFRALMSAPEEYEVFAVVVDGEVALLMPAHKTNQEMYVAVWSSNPKFVKIDDAAKTIVRPGWTYDGENFIAPQ